MADPVSATGQAGKFEHDTAVHQTGDSATGKEFAATVAPDWYAGRGPHGGYLAAMLLRAMVIAVDDPARAPRSLTVHYLRAPVPGPIEITVTLERQGRSLSSLSARMRQGTTTTALALAAFSVPWEGPEIAALPMPLLAPPEPFDAPGSTPSFDGPNFTRHMILQPRVDRPPFQAENEMEFTAWVGLREERPLDAPMLAFYCDALIPAPFMRMESTSPAPTVDLTIHFRAALPRVPEPDPHELCLARVRANVIHEGFFEEDSTIWAADGTLLAQSRQLAILLPRPA